MNNTQTLTSVPDSSALPAKDQPMSLDSLALVFIIIMLGAIYSRLGKMIEALGGGASGAGTPAARAAAPALAARGKTMHPGLSDEQFVAIISAAAAHVMGQSVSVVKFKPLNSMDWTWAVQGKVSLHSHKV